MSSKPVARVSSSAAQPILWQRVAGAGEEPAPGVQRPERSGEASVPPGDQAITALESRWQQEVIQARAAGRQEGEAAGRQVATAELQPVLQRLGAAIQEMAELRPALRVQAERDLIRLAVAIARRIIHRELTLDAQAITGLVKAGLEKVRMQEILRVRIHPDYQSAIRECLGSIGSASPVEVVADSTQARGAVIFETARGNLDLSVDTLLREIERGLADRLGSHGI